MAEMQGLFDNEADKEGCEGCWLSDGCRSVVRTMVAQARDGECTFWPFWFQTWILLWKLKSSLRPSDFSLECRFENWNHPWSFQFQTYVLMLFQTFKLARLVWWYLLAILLAELNAVPKAKIIPGHSHFRLECYSESWNHPLVILISDLNVNLKLSKNTLWLYRLCCSTILNFS